MMMGFRRIVWPIGFVRVGRVPAILNLLIPQIQNMVLKTSPCFIMDAPLTVFSARIGHTEKGFGIEKASLRKGSLKRSMTALVVSAILEEILLHNSLTPSKFLKRPSQKQRVGSFESVGRPMVR